MFYQLLNLFTFFLNPNNKQENIETEIQSNNNNEKQEKQENIGTEMQFDMSGPSWWGKEFPWMHKKNPYGKYKNPDATCVDNFGYLKLHRDVFGTMNATCEFTYEDGTRKVKDCELNVKIPKDTKVFDTIDDNGNQKLISPTITILEVEDTNDNQLGCNCNYQTSFKKDLKIGETYQLNSFEMWPGESFYYWHDLFFNVLMKSRLKVQEYDIIKERKEITKFLKDTSDRNANVVYIDLNVNYNSYSTVRPNRRFNAHL